MFVRYQRYLQRCHAQFWKKGNYFDFNQITVGFAHLVISSRTEPFPALLGVNHVINGNISVWTILRLKKQHGSVESEKPDCFPVLTVKNMRRLVHSAWRERKLWEKNSRAKSWGRGARSSPPGFCAAIFLSRFSFASRNDGLSERGTPLWWRWFCFLSDSFDRSIDAVFNTFLVKKLQIIFTLRLRWLWLKPDPLLNFRQRKVSRRKLFQNLLNLVVYQNESPYETIRIEHMKICSAFKVIFMQINLIFMSKVLHEDTR